MHNTWGKTCWRAVVGITLTFLLTTSTVDGHGALVTPKPRNSIDGALSIFDKGGCQKSADPAYGDFCYACNCGSFAPYTDNVTGIAGTWDPACKPGTRANMNGQGCLWFSNGCTIGCATCDNVTIQTHGKSLCAAPTVNATLPDWARTMNLWAPQGAANDSYARNPWRAPGYAPVTDPCGMAGGMVQAGPGASVFAKVEVAQGFGAPTTLAQGMLGSKVLKQGPAAAHWAAGDTVEVSWGIRANHGGGYSYRLCRSEEAQGKPLTEECFQKTPLKFAGPSQIRYNDGTMGPLFNRTEVSIGTWPEGSVWAMNPIPRISNKYNAGDGVGNPACAGQGYGPDGTGKPIAACREFVSKACSPADDAPSKWHFHAHTPGAPVNGIEGACSGDFMGGSIVDHVVIPAELEPGAYVLGFRWDCEQSAQIWSSCADVTIT